MRRCRFGWAMGTPVNAEKVAAVTLLFAEPLVVEPSAVDYAVAPGFMGAVHRLAPTGGIGDYSYSRTAGDASLEVGSEGGCVGGDGSGGRGGGDGGV